MMLLFIQTVRLSAIVHPINPRPQKTDTLQKAAMKAGIGDPGEKILQAVKIASIQTGISEPLLLSLMYTESSFNPKAVSNKAYKGLMQIPYSVYYEDANVLIGARIMLEKLKITNGDYYKAIILYKGWSPNHPEGKRQARKVLDLATRLQEA
jgi:soluble lytic murein transglycosylase-like protein